MANFAGSYQSGWAISTDSTFSSVNLTNRVYVGYKFMKRPNLSVRLFLLAHHDMWTATISITNCVSVKFGQVSSTMVSESMNFFFFDQYEPFFKVLLLTLFLREGGIMLIY